MTTGTADHQEFRTLRRKGILWISPWLVGAGLFIGAPVLMSFWSSLHDATLLERPVWIGLDNYRELAGDALFWRASANTLFFAVLAVVGSTLLSLSLALILESRVPGRTALRAIMFTPTLVPIVSACVTWGWMLNGRFGLLNGTLGLVGIRGPDWLGSASTALPSLVFMSYWVIGTSLLVCSAALQQVPASIYEAASLDGVSSPGRLFRITVPLISPALLFNGVMGLIWGLQVFAPPLLMTKGGPENSTLVSAMYVYQNAFVYGRMGYACALAWIQLIVTVLLVLAVLGLSRRFVYYRAG